MPGFGRADTGLQISGEVAVVPEVVLLGGVGRYAGVGQPVGVG